MTQRERFCAIIGYPRSIMQKYYSRKFLILDFLSGGNLGQELSRLYGCLGRAYMNHDMVWLPDHPDLLPILRRGKTEKEAHEDLSKNLNKAKGILLSVYKM